MNSYKLYCKKVEGQKDLVYLYLYYHPTKQKHPTLSSLKIKVPKSCIVFEKVGKSYSTNSVVKISTNLPKEYLLRTGFESVDKLNKYLNEQLEEFVKVNGRKEFVERDKKTLNEWFEILISGLDNQGTLNRYINVKNLLELFQSQRKGGSKVIYMSEIDNKFINLFKGWLMTQPSSDEPRKLNSYNSTIYKLKCLKSVINKSHFSKYYPFIVNPFDHISFSEIKRPHKVLIIDEIQSLINTELVEVYRRKVLTKDGVSLWGKPIEGGVEERNRKNKRYTYLHSLNDIRNYFLFQFFSQGLRVSDLITLRWSHFVKIDGENLRIEKVMVKTQEPIKVLVNQSLTSIISKYLDRYNDVVFKDEIVKMKGLENEIEMRKSNLERDLNYFVRKENLWWEFIPEQYREILQTNPHSKKINNTVIEGFLITKVQLLQIDKMLGEVDDVDYVEVKNLDEIHQELKKLRFSGSTNEELKKEEEKTRLRFGRFVKKYFLRLLSEEFEKENGRVKSLRNKSLDGVLMEKHKLVNQMILKLSVDPVHKNQFVFELLKDKDFVDMEKNNFSKMSKEQYKKFQSVRTYYNGLLKIVGEQCGLGEKLSSHVSRHSFTSITMELIDNVSPFDLMNSLGHKNVSTTQIYMKSFGDKSVENINKKVQSVINLRS